MLQHLSTQQNILKSPLLNQDMSVSQCFIIGSVSFQRETWEVPLRCDPGLEQEWTLTHIYTLSSHSTTTQWHRHAGTVSTYFLSVMIHSLRLLFFKVREHYMTRAAQSFKLHVGSGSCAQVPSCQNTWIIKKRNTVLWKIADVCFFITNYHFNHKPWLTDVTITLNVGNHCSVLLRWI